MMLRLILVGLVTSMGLELPSGRDVSCWAESGRSWANAQVAALTTSGVEVAPAEAPGVAVGPVEADRAFEAVGAEMAADFAADRALTCAQAQAPALALAQPDAGCDGDTAAAVAVAEAVAVARAEAEPGIIEEVVIGLPSGEEVAAVALSTPADEPAMGAVAVVAEEDMEAGDDTPSHADRLAEAVRLTREAAQAWADLIQEPADEIPCGR